MEDGEEIDKAAGLAEVGWLLMAGLLSDKIEWSGRILSIQPRIRLLRSFDAKCGTCIWGCPMPVEMIIDHWNSSQKRYRFETFCYGPKSFAFYRAGPTRKVPGRKGMSCTKEDWVDEDATAYRGQDD